MSVTKRSIRDLGFALAACGAVAFGSACSSSSGRNPITVDSGSPIDAHDSGGRTCAGSTVQTASYAVSGSCGDDGVIAVSVGSADSCTISVSEPADVGLPTTGAFSDLASETGYDLTKGSWDLNNPSSGSMNVGVFLDCTSGPANGAGEIMLTCEENVCSVGDTDDVECTTGSTCTAHLTPTTVAGAGSTPDAG